MAFFIQRNTASMTSQNCGDEKPLHFLARCASQPPGVTFKALRFAVHRATRGNGSTQEPVRPQIMQHACEVEGFSRWLGMSAIADTEEALSVAPAIPHCQRSR